jgi:hypothetical protein
MEERLSVQPLPPKLQSADKQPPVAKFRRICNPRLLGMLAAGGDFPSVFGQLSAAKLWDILE